MLASFFIESIIKDMCGAVCTRVWGEARAKLPASFRVD